MVWSIAELFSNRFQEGITFLNFEERPILILSFQNLMCNNFVSNGTPTISKEASIYANKLPL